MLSNKPLSDILATLDCLKLCLALEHGVMFYSFNSSDPVAARKKIHGGSGVRNAGDSYEPTSKSMRS
jgi:hypothetical protein